MPSIHAALLLALATPLLAAPRDSFEDRGIFSSSSFDLNIPLPPRYAFYNASAARWCTQDLSSLVYSPAESRGFLSTITRFIKRRQGLLVPGLESASQEFDAKLSHLMAWPRPLVRIAGVEYRKKGTRDTIKRELRRADGDPVVSADQGQFDVPPNAVDLAVVGNLTEGDVVKFHFVRTDQRPFDAPVSPGEIRAIGPHGWTIISDIDDTLRLTGVLDTLTVFRTTFIDPFRVVPGMPELFARWNGLLTEPGARTAVHYLSASPVALLRPLIAFLHHYRFPRGPMHLFEHTLYDINTLRTLKQVVAYKGALLRRVLDDFPERYFILVGDSGQTDPQVYGDLLREQRQRDPERAAHWCIFIRAVSGIDAEKEAKQNAPARFLWDFRDIPANQWRVFDAATELADLDPRHGCYAPDTSNPMVSSVSPTQLTQPMTDTRGRPIMPSRDENEEMRDYKAWKMLPLGKRGP